MADIPYKDQIIAAAEAEQIDPALLAGLIKQESGFNPNAKSTAGAAGLTQLMPGTAASLGVKNPLDPVQAIKGGARYLRQQLDAFGGNVSKALAAYNAGPGAVKKFGGVPPYSETENYVKVVQQNADDYRRGGLTATATAKAGSDAFDPTGGDLAPEDGDTGGGMFAPLFSGALKALVWVALILGGAALVVVGIGRISTAGKTA